MLSIQDIEKEYPAQLRPFKRNMLREYLQYKMLEAVFNSAHASKLSFIGGTALRIVLANTRFSEDLDFDNFSLLENEFEEIVETVSTSLQREGYRVEIKTVSKQAYRCYLRIPELLFEAGLSPFKEEKILIQLDSEAQGVSYQAERVILNKFDVFTPILVAPLDVLLAQKIYAAFNRKRAKGRDFFDIVFLFSKTSPNFDYLSLKLGVSSGSSLKKKLLSLCGRLNFPDLARDVEPFLMSPKDVKRIVFFPEFVEGLTL